MPCPGLYTNYVFVHSKPSVTRILPQRYCHHGWIIKPTRGLSLKDYWAWDFQHEDWCVFAAYACTMANGRPWSAARFAMGSPNHQLYWFHTVRVSVCTFLCAILWNKCGYVPCPNSAFYSSTSGVKTYQLETQIRTKSLVLRGQIIQLQILSVFLRWNIQKWFYFPPWKFLQIITQLVPLKIHPRFWPRNCLRPPAAARFRWRRTFLDYVKLPPIVKKGYFNRGL